MKTYTVGIKEVHIMHVEVEAENEREAKDKAALVYPVETNFDELEFSHTIDKEDWSACPKP